MTQALESHNSVSSCASLTPLSLLGFPQELSKKDCTMGLGWPQLADSFAGLELGWVGPLGVGRVELVHSLRLISCGKECSTQ